VSIAYPVPANIRERSKSGLRVAEICRCADQIFVKLIDTPLFMGLIEEYSLFFPP
jgi:hypothetical protein